jgi:hypothetical protein
MSISVTGMAHVVLPPGERTIDPMPFLVARKTRKFMGVQDDLAVVAASRAVEQAGLSRPLGDRAGVFFTVGYIPFEESDIAPVLAGSIVDDAFSMRAFSEVGYQRAHPLLAFRCLPNMPVFHVSANLGARGEYVASYPGPGQLYLALEHACMALEEGAIDVALLGGVAHQRNFLVEHHLGRTDDPVPREHIRDAAGVLVLERAESARSRARLLLADMSIRYQPFDPLRETPKRSETDLELGPASLMIALGSGQHTHRVSTREGLVCESRWEAP